MTFLKKLGGYIAQGAKIVGLIQPTVATMFPGAADKIDVVSRDLAQIGDIIVTVEAIGQTAGMPGPDKLKAAGPLVAQVILKSAVVGNKKVANSALFQQGAAKVADGMADVLNSLHEDSVPASNIPS